MKHIRTITVTSYTCDRCAATLEEDEYGSDFFVDADIFEVIGHECGWREINGKHYCDSCWEYDEDTADPIPIPTNKIQ